MQSGQRSLPARASALGARARFRRAGRMALGRDELLSVLEMALEPLVLVAALWAGAALMEGRVAPHYMILALVVFSLTFPSEARLCHSRGRVIVGILTGSPGLARPRRPAARLRLGQRLPALLPSRDADRLGVGRAVVPDRRAFPPASG